MSRAQRLLDLIQILRRHRYPVAGAALASELGISLRTLYRDIGTLQAQGARIEGEAGLGYVLRPGFLLPPLMFSEEEIEALVLGSRWVAERGDARLSAAAGDALNKIASVLPDRLRTSLDASTLLIASDLPEEIRETGLPEIRDAIRSGSKLDIDYRDAGDAHSRRTIWPFALGYFESSRVLVAWCELRQAFRHFRTDRINALYVLEQPYPRGRLSLLKEWREQQGIDER